MKDSLVISFNSLAHETNVQGSLYRMPYTFTKFSFLELGKVEITNSTLAGTTANSKHFCSSREWLYLTSMKSLRQQIVMAYCSVRSIKLILLRNE